MLAIAGLTTIAAGFVRGLAGFGFAVVLVPVLSLTLLPVEALMVTNVVAVLLGLSELRFLLAGAGALIAHHCGFCRARDCARPVVAAGNAA